MGKINFKPQQTHPACKFTIYSFSCLGKNHCGNSCATQYMFLNLWQSSLRRCGVIHKTLLLATNPGSPSFQTDVINKFIYLWMNCPTSCFNQFCWNLFNTWRFVSSQLFNKHLKLKGTEFRLYWLAVCIAVCLISCLISNWQKWFFHLYVPSLSTVTTLHTYHYTQGEWVYSSLSLATRKYS